MNQFSQVNENPTPKVGAIYRDQTDRSFIVRTVSDSISIQYANGECKTVASDEWQDLRPIESLF